VRGLQAHDHKFWFVKNLAKTSKNLPKKFRHFLPILIKLYLVIQSINKSILRRRKNIKTYIESTNCFLWELMSNWLTWKFGQKMAFYLWALLLIVHWGNWVCYRRTEKLLIFNLNWSIWWTHFGTLFVAYMCRWTDNVVSLIV